MGSSTRTSTAAGRRKAMGVHYTPPALARFVAQRLVLQIEAPCDAALRILDPACGDGALLEAVVEVLQEAGVARCEVVGVEADEEAAASANARLAGFVSCERKLIVGDFLELTSRETGQRELWGPQSPASGLGRAFDVVIANPPYVRTQVLGAARAQRLATRYRLTGRVDLYHAFIVAMTEALRPGGVLGIITSNRFLTTLGGAAIRRYLARHCDLDELIDLGDTKLFEAAVLPAILIGRRRAEGTLDDAPHRVHFTRVYSEPNGSDNGVDGTASSAGIYDLLSRGQPGRYRLPQGVFSLAQGDLVVDRRSAQVWSLTTADEAAWLDQVRAAACGTFGDIAAVRVGIKTTADEVFIRTDWDALPPEMQPEPELLPPLLSHADAQRWALLRGTRPAARVLYPHEVSRGHRRPVDLRRYPRAEAYLTAHRQRLENRPYVLAAGRQWYEIWVPQDPGAWTAPKIVFPDISPEPRFLLDLDGHLVDGNCYWITLREGVPADALYLLLGVANSNLMTRYHDLAFNNKLYSGRRRYITQYVSKYPCPALAAPASQELVAFVKEVVSNRRAGRRDFDTSAVDAQLDALVQKTFGLKAAGETR